MDDLEKHLSELTEAARRAGSVVNERVDEIVAAAERQAGEIRRSAEKDAEETRRKAEADADETRRNAEREAEESRREALVSADRVFERISSLERPLADLVGTLRFEADKVGRELEGQVDAEATVISAEAESSSPDASEDGDKAVEVPAEPTSDVKPPADVAEASVEPVKDLRGEDQAKEPVAQGRAATARPHAPPGTTDAPPATTDEPPATTDEPPATADAPPATTDEPPESAATERAKPWKRAPAEPPAGDVEERQPKEPDKERTKARASAPDAAAPSAKSQQTAADQPPPFMVSSPRDEDKRQGLFSRLRPGSSRRPFINTPGNCAVCQKTFEAGSEEALAASGWRVSGDVGLCPEDQAEGWQLPEGAKLPFRRGGN